jgi:thiamine-monophosphate kinase
VTVQVYGRVAEDRYLVRGGARPGDRIFVTGTLGDAALALQYELQQQHYDVQVDEHILSRLRRPSPRIREGRALGGIASSAIDISDGLLADLGHILDASVTGATIMLDKLPLSATMSTLMAQYAAWHLPLSGGDDYELCFTVAESRLPMLKNIGCTEIGSIEQASGLRILDASGQEYLPDGKGYDHFSTSQ